MILEDTPIDCEHPLDPTGLMSDLSHEPKWQTNQFTVQ